MATPAQILANRDNAQYSTGPRTEDGKRASSRNATRHGLTGSQIVIAGEDGAAYEQMRQGLHESYNPANEAERILVDQIAANAWRLERAQRLESALFCKLAEGSQNPDNALAAAFLERPADLVRMQRYLAAANTAYYKAITQLEKAQKERAAAEYEAAMIANLRSQTERRPAQREVPDTGNHVTRTASIGFVSSTSQPAIASKETRTLKNAQPGW